MNPHVAFAFVWLLAWIAGASTTLRGPLDPRGQIHIPIGVANTVDHLKTFIEPEGCFSPGFGTYGIYLWIWDPDRQQLFAPTLEGVPVEHGLAPGGALIPWSRWQAGPVTVFTEICSVACQITNASVIRTAIVTAARVQLTHAGASSKALRLYAALRPLGPAGGNVTQLHAHSASLHTDQPALLLRPSPKLDRIHAGVLPTDTIGEFARRGALPELREARSQIGDCSGALGIDLTLKPGEPVSVEFVCPVLPARNAPGHRWDGVSQWAQFDLNAPGAAGNPQPTWPPSRWPELLGKDFFAEAAQYWRTIQGKVRLQLPDPRWSEAFHAIVGHAALCMNEGAPDVTVINYNVFNRDGVYVANIFQKSGNFALAEAAIDYFLSHPFNGRVQPEADNPGQILWAMGEHWRFTRDRAWLTRVYPSARKIAAMIRYYRTTPEPHWVSDTRLEFGEALPPHQRKQLKPGACDGFNPAYTEAYDIAGLRAAAVLAEAGGHGDEARIWSELATKLLAIYDRKFGSNLPKGYGSYAVLWPCTLYPLHTGEAHDQFRVLGAQAPTDWRYFPLARAHQGLLAGNRAAGYGTLNIHLAHPQMRGWYAFDEGGPSGVGGWHHVRTTWPLTRNPDGSPKSTVAMPHGWAIAEFHLLLRDSLVYEDGERLVLFGGIPEDWFSSGEDVVIEGLPTHFGPCTLRYSGNRQGGELTLSTAAPAGCILRLPQNLAVRSAKANAQVLTIAGSELYIPPGTRSLELKF